jgi:hypothetical protein
MWLSGAFPGDDKKGALGCPVVLAVHTIGPGDCALGLEIRQQGELEFAFAGISDVTPGTVYRDTQQDGTKSLEIGKQLVVEGEFAPTHGTPVGRVKDEDHDPAL